VTLDLRMPVIGVIAWASAIATARQPWLIIVTGVVWLVILAHVPWRRRLGAATVLGWLLICAASSTSTLLHARAASGGALSELASDGAQVQAMVKTVSSPKSHQGRFSDYITVRAQTRWVVGRGARHWTRAPVLIIAPESWSKVALGSTVEFKGRLQTAQGPDLAGVIRAQGPPQIIAAPSWVHTAAEGMRSAIRRSVAQADPVSRALLPALVDGDDAGMDPQTVADFQASGLTHLTAVSGANLTLACGALVLLARWVGVRRQGLVMVAILGIVGFVILARAEPSVVRAAAMGSAALLGLGRNGRNAGMRAWGIALTVLVLFEPPLAHNLGFSLSVLATASILWLAPVWRDGLMTWLPRWAAEGTAVPLAAQLGCTPLVAAISGQVSLVAVLANLLAAPAVAPATVLGLAAGVCTLINERLGEVVAAPAVWCCRWLVLVATKSAQLPVATIEWSTSPVALALLTALCLMLVLILPSVLRRRNLALLVSGMLLAVIVVPLPTPGWPPKNWVMVVCDVGQGDGIVLHAGGESAVVVDTGPDPTLMDRCLTRLGIQRVPLIVLTHFHQDHAGGIAGVIPGREVGLIQVTTLASPPGEVRKVEGVATDNDVPLVQVRPGESARVGRLTWQVKGPSAIPIADSESPPNDASIVMLVQVSGLRILLMGDEEPPSQRQLMTKLAGQSVDVLKVAHHGSANQNFDLIRSLAPRLAVISAGVDNDYGHPAPSTLTSLRQIGAVIRRTDLGGDIAVSVGPGGELQVVERGHPNR